MGPEAKPRGEVSQGVERKREEWAGMRGDGWFLAAHWWSAAPFGGLWLHNGWLGCNGFGFRMAPKDRI